MRLRRAATLIETLVGLAIFSLVLTLVVIMFRLAHRFSRVYYQVSTIQREAVHCLDRMSALLKRGLPETLSPPVAVNATWFLSATPQRTLKDELQFDGVTAGVVYHKWVGIWCGADHRVYQNEIPLAASTAYTPLMLVSAPTSINEFQAVAAPIRLASSITHLMVTHSASLFRVEVDAEAQSGTNPVSRYSLSTSFSGQ